MTPEKGGKKGKMKGGVKKKMGERGKGGELCRTQNKSLAAPLGQVSLPHPAAFSHICRYQLPSLFSVFYWISYKFFVYYYCCCYYTQGASWWGVGGVEPPPKFSAPMHFSSLAPGGRLSPADPPGFWPQVIFALKIHKSLHFLLEN